LNRTDWLVAQLAQRGVDVRPLLKPGTISEKECQAIAEALDSIPRKGLTDPVLLEHDIRFWKWCGGVEVRIY